MEKQRKIFYVMEMYRDADKTLSETIMYIYGDIQGRDYWRSLLKPNINILYRTIYLDKFHNPIKEKNHDKKEG